MAYTANGKFWVARDDRGLLIQKIKDKALTDEEAEELVEEIDRLTP